MHHNKKFNEHFALKQYNAPFPSNANYNIYTLYTQTSSNTFCSFAKLHLKSSSLFYSVMNCNFDKNTLKCTLYKDTLEFWFVWAFALFLLDPWDFQMFFKPLCLRATTKFHQQFTYLHFFVFSWRQPFISIQFNVHILYLFQCPNFNPVLSSLDIYTEGYKWTDICDFKLLFVRNVLEQTLQAWGLSPVWIVICAFRFCLFLKVIPHKLQDNPSSMFNW